MIAFILFVLCFIYLCLSFFLFFLSFFLSCLPACLLACLLACLAGRRKFAPPTILTSCCFFVFLLRSKSASSACSCPHLCISLSPSLLERSTADHPHGGQRQTWANPSNMRQKGKQSSGNGPKGCSFLHFRSLVSRPPPKQKCWACVKSQGKAEYGP